ncbi:hypothetical protein [Thiorhodococcus minor]|uniref:Uncharacterized protein n=1 Tax=Thiorhodococcus minor TaxID=57489 RepID=A0A6M0K699_9GAMM|nr:hypothetical protein [Thiorhodococcus minor]NEV65260.1 hypothetical protein [Thiorhodococcus minor]
MTDTRVLYEEALTHHRAGRSDVAESLYRALLALDEGHAGAHHGLGSIEVASDRGDSGLMHLRRAAELSPSVEVHWVLLVQTLLATGRATEAHAVLERGRSLGADSPTISALRDRVAQALSLTPKQSVQQALHEQAKNGQAFQHSSEMRRLKQTLPQQEYAALVRSILDVNPLQKLELDEFRRVFDLTDVALSPDQITQQLSRAKQFSKYMPGRRILVAAAPKSASSYLANQLSIGLSLPFSHLTTSASFPSQLGANGREQELCEYALCRRSLEGTGFVAQHHMKGTPYLVNLLNQYGVKVIITIRNIFDAMVSADDMLRGDGGGWIHPFSQGALKVPRHYPRLPREDRLQILGNTLGVWYIDFYLSWLRLANAGSRHLLVSYERHLSRDGGDKRRLAEALEAHLELAPGEGAALRKTLLSEGFSRSEARFNQGLSGRGREVPERVRDHLIGHARFFEDELQQAQWCELFGESVQ